MPSNPSGLPGKKIQSAMRLPMRLPALEPWAGVAQWLWQLASCAHADGLCLIFEVDHCTLLLLLLRTSKRKSPMNIAEADPGLRC